MTYAQESAVTVWGIWGACLIATIFVPDLWWCSKPWWYLRMIVGLIAAAGIAGLIVIALERLWVNAWQDIGKQLERGRRRADEKETP